MALLSTLTNWTACSQPSKSSQFCCTRMRRAPNLHPIPRQKALVIALSYSNTVMDELRTAHTDGRNLTQLLYDNGFEPENVTLLMDDGNGPILTAAKILRAIRSLVEGARCGDDLVFAFIGHGDQRPNVNGTELDGKDEAIVGIDGEIILDDVLKKTLVDPIPSGAKLTILMDSCASGTVLDLPYLTECDASGRLLPYAIQVPAERLDELDAAIHSRHILPDVTCISACRDGESAWEFPGKSRSSYTLVDFFIHILRNKRNGITNEMLLQTLDGYFERVSVTASAFYKDHSRQHPQLSATRVPVSGGVFKLTRRT